MSEELKQRISLVHNIFENFSNFIELSDFRSYLLFTLTSQVPTNILAQIGLGGNKEVINLPYISTFFRFFNIIEFSEFFFLLKLGF